jgi:hypothetical protein
MATRSYKRLTASGLVLTGAYRLIGFHVANTSAGTLVLWDNTAASGTQISGTITPAAGWTDYPADCTNGVYATIGGTSLDVTFIVEGRS